jgi:glucitol operon activator protein
VFLIIFSLLALQMLMGYFQVRQYQKTVRKWLGKGILGIGQRRGLLKPGELLIVVYNPREDRVVSVQSMRGYTVFARFAELKEYAGISLEELRRTGMEKDAEEMKLFRLLRRYNPALRSKRKGALIQAVEAVDRYLQNDAEAVKRATEKIPVIAAAAAEAAAEFAVPGPDPAVLEVPVMDPPEAESGPPGDPPVSNGAAQLTNGASPPASTEIHSILWEEKE